MTIPATLDQRPFTAAMARDAGLTTRAFRRLIAEGQVVPMLRGVYRPCTLVETLEVRCQAAALVMPSFGVLCDRTAAWLHGVDTFAFAELRETPPVDTFVLRGHTRVRRPECRGGSRDLTPADVVRIFGVWVTRPLRTALDLGCSLSPRDALACLDGFMRECGVTQAEMTAALPRYRRRRGVVQLRRLVPLATPLAESPGESWTRMALLEAGLPLPQPQVWVLEDGIPRYRLDLGYEAAKVAIEYDGRLFHSRKKQRKADKKRRKWLRDHGWTVIVVDRDSFSFDAWMKWTQDVSAALRMGA